MADDSVSDRLYSGEMPEEELLSVLQEEDRDASGEYDSEMAIDQAHALDRYFARPYGDEAENRSAVVSHDLEDAINWCTPPLMRLFLNNDELVQVVDEQSDDQSVADLASEAAHQKRKRKNKSNEKWI